MGTDVDLLEQWLSSLLQKKELLEKDIELTKDMIRRYKNTLVDEPAISEKDIYSFLENEDDKKSPSQAVNDFIEKTGGASITPGQLRDYLVDLREKGILESNAKNLLWTANNNLRVLVQRGVMKKHTRKDKSVIYEKVNQH